MTRLNLAFGVFAKAFVGRVFFSKRAFPKVICVVKSVGKGRNKQKNAESLVFLIQPLF